MKKIWMVIPAVGIMAFVCSASAQSTPDTASPSKDTTTVQTTETTHTGSGQKKTTTRALRMIGSVKSIDAGKSIVVTGPKNKDYSFRLDDKNMISKLDPGVAVGDKVKVIQHTDDAGMKTLTVSPYNGHRRHHQKSQDTTSSPPPANTN